MVSIEDRCYGCFFGSVIGDSLGGPHEFKPRGSFPKVVDMNLDNFNLGLPPGGWTDDTSMMLCLAQSIIDNNGNIDNNDTLDKYVKWFRNGYMSCLDYCVDIGKQTSRSLIDYEQNGTLVSKFLNDSNAGNGGIMRLTPVPIMYHSKSVKECIDACDKSSVTTHSSKICRDASKLLGSYLYYAINSTDKSNLIGKVQDSIKREELHPLLHDIYDATFLKKHSKDIESTGYVVHTLEAALYCFFKTKTFHEAVLKAVNLGVDSDTVGCVTGQIAGAFYGLTHISQNKSDWIHKLAKKDLLHTTMKRLFQVASE